MLHMQKGEKRGIVRSESESKRGECNKQELLNWKKMTFMSHGVPNATVCKDSIFVYN